MVARRSLIAIALLALAGCSREPAAPRHPGTVVNGVWFQTNGPSSTIVWDLASSGNALVAGTTIGILRSTDLGQTWKRVSGAVSPAFLKTGSQLWAGGFHGAQVSTDDGLTWTDRGNGMPDGGTINVLAVHGTWLYAGVAGHGMYRSTDGGASWTSVNVGLPPDPKAISMLVRDTDLFIGTFEGKIFRSTDLGDSWVESDAGVPATTYEVRAMAALGSEIFATAGNNGVLSSADDGASWHPTSTYFYGMQKLRVEGTKLYAAGYGGFFFSNDGHDWGTVPIVAPAHGFLSMASHAGQLFLGSGGSGVFRCTDIPAWTGIGPPDPLTLAGPPTATVGSLSEIDGRLFVGADSYGIFHSSDGGASWQQTRESLYDPREFTAVGSHLFAAHARGLARSEDGGDSWWDIGASMPSRDVGPIASNGVELVMAQPAEHRVLRTSDLGRAWSTVSGLPEQAEVQAITACGPHFFLAAFDPATGRNVMYRSTDDGGTWTSVGVGFPAAAALSMASNGTSIYAGFRGVGVYVSRDDGRVWTSTGLPTSSIISLSARDHRVAAVTTPEGAVWVSTDDGLTWAAADQGLGTTKATAVALGAQRWYAGTEAGVWWHTY